MKKCHEWFRNAGVGMFIHWGAYSSIGRGEWALFAEKMSLAEYDKHICEFTAAKYNPDEWAKLAQEAGMRYMVLTTKHHDGFCLFDTATTDRNAVKQGPRRDLIKEYVEACRGQGLKVGLYYSPPDWSIPAFFDGKDDNPAGWAEFVKIIHEQVRELVSNYGKIDLLWYDTIIGQSGQRNLTAEDLESARLNAMVREAQPEIIINDRSLLPEDFYTAEQRITAPKEAERLWEACLTINKHWGHYPADDHYKSAAEIVHRLTAIALNRGVMLLNVGPTAEGTIDEPEQQCLRALGKWMAVNGESVRGVEPCPAVGGASYGCSSMKGDSVYLYVHWWHGDTITIPECDVDFSSGVILGSEEKVKIRRKGKHVVIENLPAGAPDPLCTVIKLKAESEEAIKKPVAKKEIITNYRESVLKDAKK